MDRSMKNFRSLSPGRKRLVREMQTVRFGRIENLQVCRGEPHFDPPPVQVRIVLLDRPPRAPFVAAKTDFDLKAKHLELFDLFDREKTLLVRELVVEDGLPVRITLSDVSQVK
jgi:hypothetical protein